MDKAQLVANVDVAAERGEGEHGQEEEMRDAMYDELADWTAKLRRDLPSQNIQTTWPE